VEAVKKDTGMIAPSGNLATGHLTRREALTRSAAAALAPILLPSFAERARAAAPKKITMKFGYTATPNNPVAIGYEKFASLVRESSNGEVNVTTFCCNQMGNDQELVQSAQSGALQMGTSSNNNLDQFTSKMMVLELPYLIKSREAYRKFWDTDAGQDIRREFETKLGLKIIMVMDAAGFRSIETNSAVIRKPSDLKGRKLRVANTPIELATLKAWGANPVPLPYNQVFTAMQQGTVDGEVLQPVWFHTDKHFEAALHVCDIHYIMLSHIGLMNLKYFEALPKDVQELVLKAGRGAENFEWTHAGEAAEKGKAALKALPGMDWYEPTGDALAEWQSQSRPVWDEFSDRIGRDLIKRVESIDA
jgi:tripartite ATP-independent transporter DctP family solute receptor